MSQPTNAIPQFIVLPFSGMQICRRLMLPALPAPDKDAVWKALQAIGYKGGGGKPANPAALRLIADHISCDLGLENTGWIAPDPKEMVFFRLVKIGTEFAIDLVVDTSSGAGRQTSNRIACFAQTGSMFWAKRHELATVYVAPNSDPRNVPGTLVMDFGNTATAFIFFPVGQQPLDAKPLPLHNPFDPLDGDTLRRPPAARAILPSTTLLLRVPETTTAEPWLVMGARAQELIALVDPLTTSMFAPKKYVRDWPAQLKAQEPYLAAQGVLGQRTGLFPALSFVKQAIKNMLQLAVSAQTNPRMASVRPECYPQIREVLLTYPLTWREQDKELFRKLVREAAESLFVLDEEGRRNFRVDLICSEPAAIAAYALWQVFFQYYNLAPGGKNLREPSIVSSLLGNTEGTQSVRLLVVDVGGGSTDVALTETDWAVEPDGLTVRFRVLESLRYNRAGDRLSHLIATAILFYLKEKHGVAESLDFTQTARNPGFTRQAKRAAICKIMELVEQCKAHLAGAAGDESPWTMPQSDEDDLMRSLDKARDRGAATGADNSGLRLAVSREALIHWIEEDRQSMESRGEPGFMDIFFDLEELQRSMAGSHCQPHLVLLSGRTTRLPFFRAMVARHLKLPLHRVRTMQDLLPPALHDGDTANADKFGVVQGAHRFRFGHPINFVPLPEEPKFKRHVGIIQQTPMGVRLVPGQVFIRPGDPHKQTRKIRVAPSASVLLGHAFREETIRAEAIATLTNTTAEWKEVEVTFENDYHAKLTASRGTEGVFLTERVSGGVETIVDNFNDTGRIDEDPAGLIRKIVAGNRDQWLLS